MNLRPTEIKLDGPAHLVIAWSDGQTRRYSFCEIRQQCPCASCREKRSGEAEKAGKSLDILPIIRPEEAQPLKLESVQPVGAYAYNIYFNHGCRNGIYTFEHLRELGEPV
jgi:DUF971 family protein